MSSRFNTAAVLVREMFSKALKFFGEPASAGPVWRGGAGDFVATLDERGFILDVSRDAGKLLGKGLGDLTGRSLLDFVHREDRVALGAVLADAFRQTLDPIDDNRHEFRLLRLSRAPAAAEISFAKPSGGRIDALVRTQRLKMAAPAAPSADLLADLSHEMKTPLNAIMGFADSMREETFGPLGDERYKEYLNHIHASGGHLMDLIGSVLDYAKIESDRYVVRPEIINVETVAKECAAMIRMEAERAGLDLNVNIDSGLPETFLDRQALRQILLNLLSNAVKFTAAGEIEISARAGLGSIDVIVRDTGVGMSAAELNRLGARYTDDQADGVRGAKGSGLGLSVAFRLAELIGGGLKLASAPGEGVRAHLTLPIVTAGGRTAPDVDRLKEPAEVTALNDPRPLSDVPAPIGRPGDIQSQLDRVAAYRKERARQSAA